MRPRSDYLILFALWLLIFSSSAQIIIIAPILPRIGEELGIAEAIQGTLVTGYAAMVGIFALITGPVSDRVGRRRILLFGSGCMTLTLFFHAIAFDFWSLLLMRALAGAAGGTLSGAVVAYIGDYFPYEKRGWAAGWVMSGVSTGQIIGIPLGTVLADLFGFKIPFMMFAATMAGAFLLIWRVVPAPAVERRKGRLTLRAAVRQYLGMLSHREIAAATLAYFLMFFSLSLFVVYLPTWLEQKLQVGGREIAALFFVGGLASVVAGPVSGRLSDTLGRKPLIVASCFGLAVVMPLTTVLISGMAMAYVLFGAAMAMLAMRVSPLQALLTALVSDRQRGMLLSMAVAIGQVGIGIGGALGGPLYTQIGFGYTTVAAAALIVLMAYIVWRFLPEPEMRTATGSRELHKE